MPGLIALFAGRTSQCASLLRSCRPSSAWRCGPPQPVFPPPAGACLGSSQASAAVDSAPVARRGRVFSCRCPVPLVSVEVWDRWTTWRVCVQCSGEGPDCFPRGCASLHARRLGVRLLHVLVGPRPLPSLTVASRGCALALACLFQALSSLLHGGFGGGSSAAGWGVECPAACWWVGAHPVPSRVPTTPLGGTTTSRTE